MLRTLLRACTLFLLLFLLALSHRPALSQTGRSVKFLATADPQYNTRPKAADKNEAADRTLAVISDKLAGNDYRGLIVAGDLTQRTRMDEWNLYLKAIEPFKKRVYEGTGNHDRQDDKECPNDDCRFPWLIRNEVWGRERTTPTNRSENPAEPHYSWDWDDVHFVQLNMFPGSEARKGENDPRHSLDFLKKDLALHVGVSGRPVVLIHHVGFDYFSRSIKETCDYNTDSDGKNPIWNQSDRKAYWDVIADYRVVAILTGHLHGSGCLSWWRPVWTRPAGKTNGPDSIPTFVTGAALNGYFMEFEITDTELKFQRFTYDQSVDSGTIDLIENPDAAQPWTTRYGYNSGGWRIGVHERTVADVNSDGKADVVGFGGSKVYVSISDGDAFGPPNNEWTQEFIQDWSNTRHVRTAADVDGDGKADLVGFADDGVWVALSTGSEFKRAVRWVESYGYNAGGWRVDKNPRVLADVNGDRRADIVGYGNATVYVSLSTGSAFARPQAWSSDFASGWRNDRHVRTAADVDGDGKADLVGFGDAGVYVAFSDGSSFGSPQLLMRSYGYSAGGWRVNRHARSVADVNGDGRADILGFGTSAIYLALSTGRSFAANQVWASDMTRGWTPARHVRTTGDVDGDGKADAVGFASNGVYVLRGRTFYRQESRTYSQAAYVTNKITCEAKYTGSFPDLGRCWTCDSGFMRTWNRVASAGACSRAIPERLTSARLHGPEGCPEETFFDPLGGGSCWSCPRGDRTLFAVNGDSACQVDLFTYTRAKPHGLSVVCHLTYPGSFSDLGQCWSCPYPYNRTANPVDGPAACSRAGGEELRGANNLGRPGCPAGSFQDPRNGGECWSCPYGYVRTWDSVTSETACVKR